MFSDLPWYGKALALVAFFAIMALWAMAWGGFVNWLPPAVTHAMFIAMVAFLAGFFVGARYGDR